MKKLFLSVATAIVALGCATTETSEFAPSAENLKDVTATVSAPQADGETRVAVSEDATTSALVIQWNSGDALGAWSESASSFAKFEMDETTLNNSKSSAEFNGSINVADDEYRLVHPYIADAVIASGVYNIDLSEQSIDMSAGDFYSLGESLYMISEGMIDASTDSAPSMKHVGAVIQLNLRFENLATETATITSIAIEGAGTLAIPQSADINLSCEDVDSDDFMSAEVTGAINLTVENSPEVTAYTVNSQTYALKLSALPFTYGAGDKLDITVVLTDKDGTTYTQIVTAENSGEAIELARATHLTINKTCDMTDAEVGAGEVIFTTNVGDVINITIEAENSSKTASDDGFITASTNSGEQVFYYQMGNGDVCSRVNNPIGLSGALLIAKTAGESYARIYQGEDNSGSVYKDVTINVILAENAPCQMDVTEKALAVGDTYQLEVSGTTDGITYISDNEYVATVDASGKVTTVGVGTARLKAIVNDIRTLPCIITVSGSNDKGYFALADFNSGGTYETTTPTNAVWVITDATANPAVTEYTGLRAALNRVSGTSTVHVELPNITTLISQAFNFTSSTPNTSLASVMCANLNASQAGQYQYATGLKRVVYPRAVSLTNNQFLNCGNVAEYVEVATLDQKNLLTLTGTGVFTSVSPDLVFCVGGFSTNALSTNTSEECNGYYFDLDLDNNSFTYYKASSSDVYNFSVGKIHYLRVLNK